MLHNASPPLLSVNSISLRLNAVKASCFENGFQIETDLDLFSNLTRLCSLIVRLEFRKIGGGGGGVYILFFFFSLQFRSNTTNAFRPFSTRSNFPVLTGLRRIFSFTWSCEIFETAAKLRETAAAIERWKLRKTSNSIETDSGTQSYKRNFEIWSRCFESASRVCSKME